MAFHISTAQQQAAAIRRALDAVDAELAQFPATNYAGALDAQLLVADDWARLQEQLRDGKDSQDPD